MNRLEEIVRFESANSGLALREHAYRADERTELLRDLLALANASVEGPRFLFLGVRDGAERMLCGITEAVWSDFKHLLGAVLADAIEPALSVATRALRLDGALIGIVCLKECGGAPYLLSAQAGEGLVPGTGWVRRGTKHLPLLRADLQRLFEGKSPRASGTVEARIGFAREARAKSSAAPGSGPLREELTLPALPLDAVPSAVAAAKLRKMLEAKATARQMLGRTETQLSRLVHAQLFGVDAAYESHSEDSLRVQITETAEQYRNADAHYEFEVRAHPIQVLVRNEGGGALHAATLALTLPRIDGVQIAEQLYPAADCPPTREGYPLVQVTARTTRIRTQIGVVPENATVAAFTHAPRLCLREAAAGKTIPVEYSLQARELREPLRDVLLIKVG